MAVSVSWTGTAVPGAVAGSSVTTLTVDISGAPVGDVACIVVGIATTQTTGVNTPAGWTRVGIIDDANRVSAALLWKIKASGDTTVAVTWPTSAKAEAVPFALTGIDTTTPFEGWTSTSTQTTSSAALVTASVTPTAANRQPLGIWVARGATAAFTPWTADASLTKVTEAGNTVSAFVSVMAALGSSAVTQAAHTYSSTPAASYGNAGSALAYAIPAAAGGGGTAGSVTGVAAVVTAAAVIPGLTAPASEAPPAAVATAVAPVPAVSGQQVLTGSVTGVPATASAAGVVPVVTAGAAPTLFPPAGVLTANAVAPGVVNAVSITAAVASATGVAVSPGIAGSSLLTGDVVAVAATASAVGVPPVLTGGQAPTLSPPAVLLAAGMATPAVGGGTAALTPPPGSALAGAVSPAVVGLVVLAGSVSSVPAAALTGASAPVVLGGGATPGSVSALPVGLLAGAVAPSVGTRAGAYYVGYGGALVFAHEDSRITLTVDVFNPSGRPVVYSDSARTVQVPLPLTFNQPGLYSLFFLENYEGYLSVLRDGEEVASKPDSRGVLPFVVRNEEWLVFAPGRDPM